MSIDLAAAPDSMCSQWCSAARCVHAVAVEPAALRCDKRQPACRRRSLPCRVGFGTHCIAGVAWVPSPTAATLHAIHYHAVDVADRQAALTSRLRASLDDILTPPLLPRDRTLSKAEVQSELDNNAQVLRLFLRQTVTWRNRDRPVPATHAR